MTIEADAAIKHYIAVRDAHPFHVQRIIIKQRLAEVDRDVNETIHSKVQQAIDQAFNCIDNSGFNSNEWADCMALAQELQEKWAKVFAS
jgi:hypothetical protein